MAVFFLTAEEDLTHPSGGISRIRGIASLIGSMGHRVVAYSPLPPSRRQSLGDLTLLHEPPRRWTLIQRARRKASRFAFGRFNSFEYRPAQWLAGELRTEGNVAYLVDLYFAPWIGRTSCPFVIDLHDLPECLDDPLKLSPRRERVLLDMAVSKAKAIVVSSEADRSLFLREYPSLATKAILVPNCVPSWLEAPSSSRTNPNGSILFVGTLKYGPNREAATFICRKLAPIMSDCTFRLIGGNEKELPVDIPSNVKLVQSADSLQREYQDSSVVVVPVFSGRGTRVKLLEALYMRRPVVSTAFGACGIDLVPGREYLPAEGPEEFRNAITSLQSNTELRESLASSGQHKVLSRYLWAQQLPFVKEVMDLASSTT